MIEIEIDDGLRQLAAQYPSRRDKLLRAVGLQAVNEWKLSMQRTSTGGRGVSRTQSGRRHYHSLPGNPPAIDYGNLINSLRSEANKDEVKFYGAHYGLILDQQKNRPFIEDGIRAVDIARLGATFLEG